MCLMIFKKKVASTATCNSVPVEPATTQKTERHWHIWRLASIKTAVFKRIQRRPACTTQFLHWFLGSRHPTLYKKNKTKTKQGSEKRNQVGTGNPLKDRNPAVDFPACLGLPFACCGLSFFGLSLPWAGQPPTIDLTSASPSHDGIEDITPRVPTSMADTFRETASIARASPAPTTPPHLGQACQHGLAGGLVGLVVGLLGPVLLVCCCWSCCLVLLAAGPAIPSLEGCDPGVPFRLGKCAHAGRTVEQHAWKEEPEFPRSNALLLCFRLLYGC